jgi:hypothetical protein
MYLVIRKRTTKGRVKSGKPGHTVYRAVALTCSRVGGRPTQAFVSEILKLSSSSIAAMSWTEKRREILCALRRFKSLGANSGALSRATAQLSRILNRREKVCSDQSIQRDSSQKLNRTGGSKVRNLRVGLELQSDKEGGAK